MFAQPAQESTPSVTTETSENAFSLDWSVLTNPDWWVERVAEFAPRVLAAVAVYLIGSFVARLFVRGVAAALRARDVDETLTKFLSSVLRMALLAMVIIAALGQLGVKTTSFVAILGAATLAIGFALQESLGSLAAGVMLIFFRPFRVGDFVEAGGTTGIVEEISIFHTVLRTPDNKRIVVPNNKMSADSITNYSANDTRRVDMVFGCGYGDDLAEAKRVLAAIVAEDERVMDEPACDLFVLELGADSVNFALRPWVKKEDYWGVWGDVHEQVKLRFDAAGLSIPYPQRDVHLHTVEGAQAS